MKCSDGAGDFMKFCDCVGDLMNYCDGVSGPVKRCFVDPVNRSVVF